MNGRVPPVLIVPDVHLRIGTLRSTLSAWGDSGPVVFLGDFFDDFGDTPEVNREMAEFLRDEILPNPGYTVVIGNHDLNYHPLCPSELWCSGFHPDKKKAIGEVLGEDSFSIFKWAHAMDGILLTHAGLHPRLVPPFSGGGADELADWVNGACRRALETRDASEPLMRAGRMRGGYQPVGGVIWMDVREYQPIGDLRQVFGHTPLRRPMPLDCGAGGSWCLDTNLDCVGVACGGEREIRIVRTDGPGLDALRDAYGKALKKGPGASHERGGGREITRQGTP